ncbi:HAD-IIA family hydrolase [Geodermatophilus sp. SYSU D00815]
MTDTTAVDTRLAERLAAVRGVLFDVDGCLVLSDSPGGHGGEPLPGAAEALAQVRAAGRSLVVFTNASSQVPAQLAASLRGLGLAVADEEVLTPSVVAAEVVRERFGSQPVLAFGGPGLLDVLTAGGVTLVAPDRPADAVAVVVGWDTNFTRDRLQAAADALWSGADLLVCSDARRFASRTRPMAGVGGFIAQGLSYVTQRGYEVLGKPSPIAMAVAARRLGVPAEEVLVAGDDLTLEARMARAAGAVAVLVTTGMHGPADVAGAPPEDRPDLVVDGLPQLMRLWRAADEARA